MEEKRSISILAAVHAGINGSVLVAITLLYFLRPTTLQGLTQVEVIVGLSLLGVLYYASLHQYIKRLHPGYSALALTLISTLNLVLVIIQTGGLDSPFYSLWLLVIVASGIFGTVYSAIAIGGTTVAYIVAFAQHGFNTAYFFNHATQLLVSVLAGGLAEWIYYRGTRTLKATTESLSGQLGEEQLKAQALMSSMADGVVVVDAQRHVQLFNRAAQQMTGWDETSAQNMDYHLVMNLKTADDRDITDQNDPFVECWNKNTSIVKNTLVMTTRNGHKVSLSISVSPIYNNDKQITGGIAVFRDVSDEKEAERQRNEFVSTASHEMRTPVAAIEGYISLAMNAKVAAIDDRAMNFLEKAHENTQHLGALFRDLLSITKLDEGLIARNLIAVDLTKMMQDITSDMQFSVAKKKLNLTLSGGDSTGKNIMPIYTVMADSERLREVIMNLIENAIKFTQEGGITLGLAGDDKTVTVKVQDTGFGIAQEDIQHLFQKFYRIDNSATRTIGGTGLGLYLCRTIIELFNGRIWVESTVGKGSSFNFTLPRVAAAANLQPVQPAAPSKPALQPVPIPTLPVPTPAATTTPTAPQVQTLATPTPPPAIVAPVAQPAPAVSLPTTVPVVTATSTAAPAPTVQAPAAVQIPVTAST